MKIFHTLLAIILLTACTPSIKNKYNSWTEYLGGPDRNHYSTLAEIDTINVKQLEIAWTYESPDSGQMQMNPVMVNGAVYGVTAGLKAFALDASTGKELWLYTDSASSSGTSRGVTYWEDGTDKRIFYAVGANLVALNATDGTLIPTFGDNGKVNLHTGLPDAAKDKYITGTTPGTIYNDLIIMPVRVGEDAGAAPGDVRAFDVRTGKLVWTFHTIPYPGEPGYLTWPKETYKNTNVGAVNNWAGMALDKKTGTIFIPLGSAAPDFYGGNRIGTNLFANCLLALNAADGSYKWHYQTMHHDLWDRDLPAPPNLITVTKNGKKIDAVAQITKKGTVFVFNRETGEPLFPINETAAIPSLLDGEQAWPTQPVPSLPKPFAREANQLSENDISPYANNKEELKNILMNSDKRLFAPPDTTTVLLLPGYDGGAEYGGAGADPENGIIYVNANEMAWFLRMEKREEILAVNNTNTQISAGEQTYRIYCAVCHGIDRKGNAASGTADLSTLLQKHNQQYAIDIISKGKAKMPGFPNLTNEVKQQLIDYLFDIEKKEVVTANLSTEQQDLYQFTGYIKFLDDNGLPAISPPWGTLTAIDLNTGDHIWQTTLGITPGLPDQDTNPTGCENYGGPIITENGLLLIAGTKDGMFRAFNRFTGKLIWETKLPAASFATPAMYSIKGKQYVVLACGGEKLGTLKGNAIVAFGLD
jgi:quinoprotein glucose dehydrogenase